MIIIKPKMNVKQEELDFLGPFLDEFVKSLVSPRDHGKNIFNYNLLSLWALCSPWLIFSFYESIFLDRLNGPGLACSQHVKNSGQTIRKSGKPIRNMLPSEMQE